ncbi:unnamed protein product [marine sediment metagenome]|uniref:Uncharacterized protein n=1 Tax=marine sediment metagenome TaxID=412755 RepID=X0ZJ98_9ZZZZ
MTDSNDKPPPQVQRLKDWNEQAQQLSDHSARPPLTGSEATQRQNDEQASSESRLTLEQVYRRRKLTGTKRGLTPRHLKRLGY